MAISMWSRRRFLATATTAAVTAPLSSLALAQSSTPLLLSACANATGQYFVQAITLTGQVRWQVPLEERAHAVAIHPHQPLAAVFARRPGTSLYLLDIQNGVVLQRVESDITRHFYGHGCFSRDGQLLYCTENAYAEKRGVIGIYQVPELTRLGEWPSYGIGPHEVLLHPQQPQLIVANGGILTHPDLPRRKLNLASMSPSLVYIDMHSGELHQQFKLPEPQSSIRHLTVNAQGQVGLALQQQNNRDVPLVAFQQGEQPIQLCQAPTAAWTKMQRYTASICLADTAPVAAVTCPRGNLVTFWNSERGEYLGALELADAGGVTYHADQEAFWVSTGLGEIVAIGLADLTVRQQIQQPAVRWDNHWVLAT